MRDPIENVSLLQKQLNELQLENQLLKNILDRSGMSYVQELKDLRSPEETSDYDANQGTRIIHPGEITDNMANLFYSRFWGVKMFTPSEMKIRHTNTYSFLLVLQNIDRITSL